MKRGMGKSFNMFWKKAHNQEFKCKRSIQYDKALRLTTIGCISFDLRGCYWDMRIKRNRKYVYLIHYKFIRV